MIGNAVNKLEHFISFFEKPRFTILTLFLWVIFLSFLRTWMEAYLFDYVYKDLTYENIFYYFHIISFYITVFLGGILVLKFFTKERLEKISNLTALGFSIIIFPPIIDFFILNRTDTYRYVPVELLTKIFIPFTSDIQQSDVGGWGLFLEIFLILIFTAFYTLLKTKSVLKTIGNFFTLFLFIVFIATPSLNPIMNYFYQSAGLSQPFILLRYLVLSPVLLLLILYITEKKIFNSFIKSTRPFTNLHAILMVSIGVLIAGNIKFDINNLTDSLNVGNLAMVGISTFIVLFLWQFTVMINHIYDKNIDEITNKDRLLPQGILTTKQAKQISIIYALIAISLSISLGLHITFLSLIAITFGVLYSVPPIRLRNSVFSTAIIGIGSTIAYFIGYLTPTYTIDFLTQNSEITHEYIRTVSPISSESLIIGFLISVLLTIGPLVTDLKDFEGDKNAGVKSIYTVLGKKKGIKTVSIILFLAFVLPLLLFYQNYLDFIIFPFLAVIAAFVFYKYQNIKIVLIFYMIIAVYSLIRWIHFL